MAFSVCREIFLRLRIDFAFRNIVANGAETPVLDYSDRDHTGGLTGVALGGSTSLPASLQADGGQWQRTGTHMPTTLIAISAAMKLPTLSFFLLR